MKIFTLLFPFLLRMVKAAGSTALTPLLEKNIVKTMGLSSPLVFSMSRLIALAFAGVMLREFWHTGIDGWPDAALGITTVLALPLLSAVERASPDEVVALTRLLMAKIGTEPSRFDDHRPD